jgi:predicted TIM-barrel fold metal-dependent hydrolase
LTAVRRQLVVDADAHVRDVQIDKPQGAWSGLAERHPGWITAGTSAGRRVTQVDGKLFPRQEGNGRGVPIDSATNPACEEGARDVAARIRDLDSEGIDIQVLFGGLMLATTTFSDAGFAADFASTYNDWLLDEICAVHPDRLRGAAAIPLQDVDRAVAELRRAAAKGAVAVTVPPVLGERTLDDKSLLPFFEAAAGTGIAVAVHSAPGMNVPLPAAGLFSNYAQVHCLSFPVDQMVAFVALSMGGVLDRFPRLRVAFLESGAGWVPYLIERVHEHKEKRGELLAGMRSEPREYLERGQCYFSFECEESLLGCYVEHLGDSSLVYSSDYPHWDSDFPGTVTAVRGRNGGLGDATLSRLLGGNAMRLYGLEALVSA